MLDAGIWVWIAGQVLVALFALAVVTYIVVRGIKSAKERKRLHAKLEEFMRSKGITIKSR